MSIFGKTIDNAASKVTKTVSKAAGQVQSEVIDPLTSTGSAASKASDQATKQAVVAQEKKKKEQAAMELRLRRRPLLLKGRQSTILAGRAPELTQQQTGARKTLLGG